MHPAGMKNSASSTDYRGRPYIRTIRPQASTCTITMVTITRMTTLMITIITTIIITIRILMLTIHLARSR